MFQGKTDYILQKDKLYAVLEWSRKNSLPKISTTTLLSRATRMSYPEAVKSLRVYCKKLKGFSIQEVPQIGRPKAIPPLRESAILSDALCSSSETLGVKMDSPSVWARPQPLVSPPPPSQEIPEEKQENPPELPKPTETPPVCQETVLAASVEPASIQQAEGSNPPKTATKAKENSPKEPESMSKSKARRVFTTAEKIQVYNKFEGRCAICGAFVPVDQETIDHVIPLCKGGTYDMDNLQLACKCCNCMKQDLSMEDFSDKLEETLRFQKKKRRKDFLKKIQGKGAVAKSLLRELVQKS